MTARLDRLADARTWDGYRSAHYARQTGTLVIVVDAAAQGLEDSGWATICEDHGRLVIHDTRALAESHASDPAGWCGVCAGTEDPS